MILVTGSTGFVGINLLVKLSKNRVVALYRNDRKKSLAEEYTADSGEVSTFLGRLRIRV